MDDPGNGAGSWVALNHSIESRRYLMSGNIERRIERLEHAVPAATQAYVWRDAGQTADEAIVLRFPDGVPAGAEATVYSWLDSAN